MSAAVQRIFAGLRSSSTYRLSRSLASFRSPLPEINFPKDLSYPEYILSKCDRYPDRRAIVCANTGRGISYRDLRAGTASVASGLARLGFGRGDVMCLYSHNFPEYPTAMYGIMSAGGILTTANPDYTAVNYNMASLLHVSMRTEDHTAHSSQAVRKDEHHSTAPDRVVSPRRILAHLSFLDLVDRTLRAAALPLGYGPLAAILNSPPHTGIPNPDSLIRSYLTGYKKGIQNIFILIDRLCHESERLTKAELVDKIKKGYLDNADSPAAIGREKLAALASAPAPSPISAPSAAASRPALGDLSNQHSATPPTPKKLSTTSLAAASATATAAAALIELSASPNPRSAPPPPMRQLQPPAKKRRAFREQPPPPEQPRYEPISPGPYEPTVIGDRCCLDDSGGVPTGDSLWRPW
uniref:AMP-binding domain-containing protein n=1 Tax=Macrostomum lignano TaxID=282301 RepID=A0A1I8IID9_9PLAT